MSHRLHRGPGGRSCGRSVLLVPLMSFLGCAAEAAPPDTDQPADPPPTADASLPMEASPFAPLFDQGIEFTEFLEDAERRRDTWHRNYENTLIEPGALERARALGGAWRLLVVAEDWCGDSANTIPYLARLVEAVDALEMRVVNSTVGRELMEAHRTPDGRGATPTVLVLDPEGRERGCWIERPGVLQDWWLGNEDRLEQSTLLDRKYSWYDFDAGEHTISDVLDVLEGAESGRIVCGH